MTPGAITAGLALLASLRAWCGRHLTPSGRRAMKRRQRERELRAAGVSKSVAAMAASRMVPEPGQKGDK